jgi:hypothetical protein
MIQVKAHPYDRITGSFLLRPHDATHQNLKVGDIIGFGGHSSIMDRQKFRVVSNMTHPTLGHALSSIDNSHMSARDKIMLKQAFLEHHGPEHANLPVSTLHLAPHPASPRSF